MTGLPLLDWNAGAAAKAAGSRPSPAATFDRDRGLRERDRGIARNDPTLVRRLRDAAIRVSIERGEAHADDVREFALREGIDVPKAAWGAVWAHPRWKRIGTRASAWPACHGHKSGVYRWE